MDSLTQIALGAAVGEAVAGRQVGRRALLWGAICGTIPDLDVFVPLGDAVRDFTYHRSASHSLFVLLAITPLLVWLIQKIHPSTNEHRWRWFVLVYLVFASHVLLDSFTVYGTQIFWPLVTTPIAWSTIFIIDPLYTVPLLIGVIAAALVARHKSWGYVANSVGLVLSTGYLMWTLGVKVYVDQVSRVALDNQNIDSTVMLTTPSPFNSLLWRVLAVDESNYYEGFYSILDNDEHITFTTQPRSLALLGPLQGTWSVQRLQWFSKGLYAVAMEDKAIIMTDLRMGFDRDYVFRFKVGEIGNPHAHPVTPQRISEARNLEPLHWVWQRIWDETAEKKPTRN
jgi:inner membrane protein